MSDEDAFVALVGAVLTHVTSAANVTSIRDLGLLPSETLALRSGIEPDDILLREAPVTLRLGQATARLNHQRPLRAGRSRAAQFLDGHTLEAWAMQLDRRVFFWPARAPDAFARSLDRAGAAVTLRFDARMLFRRCGDRLDLSPINSGSALRQPARRGDWLYVPATQASRFADARRLRGAARARDQVAEMSLRGGLSPEALAACLVA